MRFSCGKLLNMVVLMLPLLVGLVVGVVGVAGLGGCARGSSASLERFTYAQLHMGSKARIVLYAEDERKARAAAGAAFARLAELDAALSDYRQDSEINRLCARGVGGAGVWTPVSDDLFRVLARADELAGLTMGAFDHTVGPLSALWREARRNGSLPPASELEDAMRRVGWRLVRLHPTRGRGGGEVMLEQDGMRIDFGAIGKGFGADEALRAMRGLGVERALVELGGDMAVGDPPPGESAWRIEIETGYGSGAGAGGRPVVLVANAGVATSGDTEQYIELGGVRYSHILDPRTGAGLTTRTAATVVAIDGATADALASAACVLGSERARELLEKIPGLGVRMMVDGVESRFGPEAHRIESTHENH
ncbi:MAG: FAD:protein FMN transferase [Planctomycetota bacterium]|nr:FAD:protein FMN transferase [Planctomycetota bacterium]